MSKAQILSNLVANNQVLNDGEITLSDIPNVPAVAYTGSYTDLSNQLTTDTLPQGSINRYANTSQQFALIHIIRG